MTRLLTFIFAALTAINLTAADEVLRIVRNGINDYALLSDIDSIYFDEQGKTMYIQPLGNASPVSIPCTEITTLDYLNSSLLPSTISINYKGNTITAENPFLLSGVTIAADGAYVTVKNANTSVEYTTELSGTTTDGSLTYEGGYKTTIVLNGVSIASQRGAAIDIQCGKRIALELKKGTVNTLIDSTPDTQHLTPNTQHLTSSTHKATLYCKGHLEIDKAGTLNVTGNTAHAISAKEYILLKKSSGTINILGAKNDGIHCQQYFAAKGYTVNISNISGDGIQAEAQTLDEGETYAEDYDNGSIQIMDGTFSITSTTDGGVRDENDNENENENENVNDNVNVNDNENENDNDNDNVNDNVNKKSYKVYVAKTVGTNGGWGGNRGGNYWNNIYLYKSDGTFVTQLTNTVTITGTNGQSLQFYYYDFGKADTDTYYFKSDNYTSNTQHPTSNTQQPTSNTQQQTSNTQQPTPNTYTIVSAKFTGPQSGIDYYYQLSNSYTTSGTTRTFPLTSVQEVYGGTSGESGDTYNYNCLKADQLISISGGTLTLNNSGTMSKSIKAGNSDYEGTVTISGGDITCNVSGDMYLSGANATYCAAIKTDNYYGTGGSVTINASRGKAIRGISADKIVSITDGTYTITNNSDGQLGSNDTYTAKCITCDKDIALTGGTFTLKATGTGGKCIKADGEITLGDNSSLSMGEGEGRGFHLTASTTGSRLGSSSGGGGPWGGQQTSTSSSSKAIKALGQITINGGSLTVTTATDGAEGLESKTSVLIRGGNHYFKCYDDCINSAGVINFAGGTTVCYATKNDAVDSNYGRSGAITISGGNIFAYTSAGSPEEGLDCDNNSYITITGGIAVSAGGSQGGGGWGGSTTGSVGSASQGYYLGGTPSSYTTTNYYTLYSTTGEAICTYKFEGNVSNTLSLLTAPNLGKGTVTIKQGTSAPTASTSQVTNPSGTGVFFIAPTVTTSSTTASVTAK